MASKYFLECSTTLVTMETQIELLIDQIAPQEE